MKYGKIGMVLYTPFQVDRSRGEKGHHFRISVVSPTHQLSLI